MDWKPPTGAGEFELRKTVPMGGINALQSSHYPNRVSYWITSTQFQRLDGISTVYSKRDIIGLPCEPRAFMTYVDVMSENPLVYCVNPLGPQAISVTNWIFQEQLPPLMLDHIRFVRSYINWAQHPRPSMISENIEIHRSLFFFYLPNSTKSLMMFDAFLQKNIYVQKPMPQLAGCVMPRPSLGSRNTVRWPPRRRSQPSEPIYGNQEAWGQRVHAPHHEPCIKVSIFIATHMYE
jgi:hypothetical protein